MTNLLLVCTANRCRSPIAEALLRQRLPRWSHFSVSSAGFLVAGAPVPREAMEQTKRFGIDLTGHRSVQVNQQILENAELILTMTRAHVRSLIDRDPTLRPKCFTLKDFVGRGQALHLPVHSARELSEVAARLDDGRTTDALVGSSDADDIADPMGRPATVWRSVVSQLSDQTDRLATMLAESAA